MLTPGGMVGNRNGWRARALGLLLLACARPAAGLERLLSSGDVSGDGTTVIGIRAYAIGAGGAVAARVQSGVDTTTQAIVVRAGGRPWVTVARTGMGAPGGGVVEALGRIAVGIDGVVIVRADVGRTDGSTAGQILSCDLSGVCRRLVGTGDRTPSSTSHRFTSVDVPVANVDGLVVFRGADDGGGMGLYRVTTNGSITTLMQSGDAMPGGGTFETFGGPALATDGAIAFFASGPLDTATRKGIFLRTAAGELRAVAGIGDDAPGGGTFSVVQAPAIGDDGTVAFRATRLDDEAVTHAGIFLAGATGVTTVLQQNDVGPRAGTYIEFEAPALGGGGLLAVRAALTLPTNAIVALSGSVQVLAGAGDPAPFGGVYAAFADPVTGPRRRVLFSATMADARMHLLSASFGDEGQALVGANCNLGGSLAAALDAVADQGTISVTGACHESVTIDDERRIRLVGTHRGKRRGATLTAADDAHPVFDVRPTAGAISIEGFAVITTSPLRIRGAGHALLDLDVHGGIDLGGDHMQVDGLLVRDAESACLVVGASDSSITRTRLSRCAGDGVAVTADRVTLDHLVVQGARGRGGLVSSDGNQILKSRFVGNRGTGLRVTGGGSTLTGNRVLRNREGGLLVQGCNVDGGHNRAAGNRGGPNRDFKDCTP